MTSLLAQVKALGSPICLDMETALAPLSFQGEEFVRLLQLASDNGELWWDLADFRPQDWDDLKVALENPSITWVGQNIGFDYRCLLGCGIKLRGPLEDTMIQSQLLNCGLPNVAHNLQAIAKRVLDIDIDKTLQGQDWMNASLTEEDLTYAMGDVRVTMAVWQEQRAQIKTAGLQKVYDLERALIPAVVEMEHTGMLVDQRAAHLALSQLQVQIDDNLIVFLNTLDSRLIELHGPDAGLPRDIFGKFNTRTKASGRGADKIPAGFNVNSPVQVLKALSNINITPTDPKTGKLTTDKKVLRPLSDDPVVAALLAYKKAEKRRSMVQGWLDKNIERDGRIHARFSPLSTGTGRFSCSSPNLQQTPRETFIRDCFIAPPGYELAVMDVAAMELRVACSAPIADEVRMQQAFRDGVDPHLRTAALMFGISEEAVEKSQRQLAKGTNFGAVYGSGAGGLKDYFTALGLAITLEEASEFLQRWRESYPNFVKWHQRCAVKADEGVVRMVDNRRRFLVGDLARPTVYANNQVQGTSASIVKATMVGVRHRLPQGAKLIAQIHDELIVEAPQGTGAGILEMMKEELYIAGQQILGNSVAMLGDGSVAASWGQAK